MVALGSIGALSTWSKHQPGFPFGSVMPYAEDELGQPIFLISALAMHTQNLAGDRRASLLITEDGSEQGALGSGRLTLIGEASKIPKEERDGVREFYLARHPKASYWVDYGDFAFYRQEIRAVYYVGGFGMMGWVEADEYSAARCDPLAEEAGMLLKTWNTEHAGELIGLGQKHGGAPFEGEEASAAQITGVDRLGLKLRMTVDGRPRSGRIAFAEEVRTVEAAGEALGALLEADIQEVRPLS